MPCRLAIVAHHQADLMQQLEQWQTERKNTSNCYFSVRTTSPGESQLQATATSDLHELAKLWIAGNTVSWRNLHKGKHRVRITGLPTYPFKRRTCWIDRPYPPLQAESAHLSEQQQENKAIEFYALVAENSTEVHTDYLTFCPFAEKVPGFSMSQVFLYPEKYPDQQRLMQIKQTEMRQVLFCQEDFQQVHTLLDIGCGHGTDVIQIAVQYPHITAHGFTTTQAPADRGQQAIAELNLSSQAQISHKDSAKDAFPARYDLIIGIEVTFHIRNKAGLFHNITTALNEHGRVLLMDYISNLRGAIVDHNVEISIPTQKEWLDLL